MKRGRPRVIDPAAIRMICKLHQMGMSARKIAEVLEKEGFTNTKGRRFDAKQILRLAERGPDC